MKRASIPRKKGLGPIEEIFKLTPNLFITELHLGLLRNRMTAPLPVRDLAFPYARARHAARA